MNEIRTVEEGYKEALRRIEKARKTKATTINLNRLMLAEIPKEIEQLSGSLKMLNIYGNKIIDISPISKMLELENLNCDYNQITDITPMAVAYSLSEDSIFALLCL